MEPLGQLIRGGVKLPKSVRQKFAQRCDLRPPHEWELEPVLGGVRLKCKICQNYNLNSNCSGYVFPAIWEEKQAKKSLHNHHQGQIQNMTSSDAREKSGKETFIEDDDEEEETSYSMTQIKERVEKEELQRKNKQKNKNTAIIKSFQSSYWMIDQQTIQLMLFNLLVAFTNSTPSEKIITYQEMVSIVAMMLVKFLELMENKSDKVEFIRGHHNWALNVKGVRCCKNCMVQYFKAGNLLDCSGEEYALLRNLPRQEFPKASDSK